MVGQERKHPALIWCVAYDMFADVRGEPSTYWRLVNENDSTFFAGTQYATITKHGKRWMLERFEGPNPVVTYHRSLKEAKALGLVQVRFNMAQRQA